MGNKPSNNLDDEKYHHGIFEGPNKNRAWSLLRNFFIIFLFIICLFSFYIFLDPFGNIEELRQKEVRLMEAESRQMKYSEELRKKEEVLMIIILHF
jgi:hypothetical protein